MEGGGGGGGGNMIGQLESLCTQFPFQFTLTPIGVLFKISLCSVKLPLCKTMNTVAIYVHLELTVLPADPLPNWFLCLDCVVFPRSLTVLILLGKHPLNIRQVKIEALAWSYNRTHNSTLHAQAYPDI